MKTYETVNTTTGEVTSVIKYLPAQPFEYRYNGSTGGFQQGETPLFDPQNKPVRAFTIQPIAWRAFDAEMFNRKRVDKWVELFFVDDKGRLSHILFNNSSVTLFMQLAKDLFYDGVALNEVVLSINSEKITKDVNGQQLTWYAAKFEYTKADPETVEMYADFAADFPIYAERTISNTEVYHFKSANFLGGQHLFESILSE